MSWITKLKSFNFKEEELPYNTRELIKKYNSLQSGLEQAKGQNKRGMSAEEKESLEQHVKQIEDAMGKLDSQLIAKLEDWNKNGERYKKQTARLTPRRKGETVVKKATGGAAGESTPASEATPASEPAPASAAAAEATPNPEHPATPESTPAPVIAADGGQAGSEPKEKKDDSIWWIVGGVALFAITLGVVKLRKSA